MNKENTFKILCPYCNVVWTAEMEDDLSGGGGCNTCDNGNISGTIEIKCSNCKK